MSVNADSDFVEFLRTGQLSGVKVGDPAEHVRARFGEPEETTRVGGGCVLWAYSGRLLQVTFDAEGVRLIGLYPGRYDSQLLPGSGAVVPFDRDSSRDEVFTQLANWGLSFKRHPQLEHMYVRGKVSIVFNEDAKLDSLKVHIDN